MIMTDKLRIGIVGCGGMAKAHAGRFEKILDQVQVTTTVDVDRERAQAVADHLGGDVKVLTDYREALDHVDAMLLVLPHHLHHEATIECLNAGKHVLLEKPMANTEAQCLEMIAAAERNDRVLMIAYCMRFHPLVTRFQELLEKKTYGEVFQVSIWTEQLTRRDPGNWMCRADQVGGGQLFSHGCHYIDIMLSILGRPTWGSHIGTNLGTPWMEREGTSNVSIAFENGALGYHFGTWGARGTRLRYSFHAHCEAGMLEADISDGKLIFHGGADKHVPGQAKASQKETLLFEAKHAKPTEEEMSHFVDCVRNGTKPLTDPASSLEGLRVIWKLYEAEDNHQLADLRDVGVVSR